MITFFLLYPRAALTGFLRIVFKKLKNEDFVFLYISSKEGNNCVAVSEDSGMLITELLLIVSNICMFFLFEVGVEACFSVFVFSIFFIFFLSCHPVSYHLYYYLLYDK